MVPSCNTFILNLFILYHLVFDIFKFVFDISFIKMFFAYAIIITNPEWLRLKTVSYELFFLSLNVKLKYVLSPFSTLRKIIVKFRGSTINEYAKLHINKIIFNILWFYLISSFVCWLSLFRWRGSILLVNSLKDEKIFDSGEMFVSYI